MGLFAADAALLCTLQLKGVAPEGRTCRDNNENSGGLHRLCMLTWSCRQGYESVMLSGKGILPHIVKCDELALLKARSMSAETS